MGSKRDQTLRRKIFQRDNFTCKKCKIEDKDLKVLEAHHIIPLYAGGKNEIDNMITLCSDCHHYAPDKLEDFKEYMFEELDGTSTFFLKVWKKLREEHPELFKELDKKN
jgi:predicted HNH restriction endonuclease